MMREVREKAPSRGLGPEKRQGFICSGEAEARSRCDQEWCEELLKPGILLLWETDILEGVDCSHPTRGGKWEQIDEF